MICIYENPSSLSSPEYSCAAILGIKSRDEVRLAKKTIDSSNSPSKILDYIENKYSGMAYYGDLELSAEHAFINIKHASTDRALIILHNVNSNKSYYLGGIGTINSISKGRERMPVIQFMGLSRHALTMSTEEIHHSLLLNYPTFDTKEETEEMIRDFKTLYLDEELSTQHFSERQKAIVIQSNLERFIKKNLERNLFRYSKLSFNDDDDWYHAIKLSAE